MTLASRTHIVVVEAYQGYFEFLTDEPEELLSAHGLGLPLEELAQALDCRITVLCWDDWQRYELSDGLSYGSPFTWVPKPVTRPVSPRPFSDDARGFPSDRVRRVPVPARDPEFNRNLRETGLKPLSHGLIPNNDLMFFLSYCLREELVALQRRDPFLAVILPMWGGLGYLPQLARATGTDPGIDVPFVLVATDSSACRQRANLEGYWTLEAGIRRQMEDASLALADAVLAFGPRGMKLASEGRLPEAAPATLVPRRVSATDLDRIRSAGEQPVGGPAVFFLYEPQQPASGALVALDGVALLAQRGVTLAHPVVSGGPPMVFAPMTPRDFESYWSTRGFVRDLVDRRQWKWQRERLMLQEAYPVRIFPSLFEHLPYVFGELARGSLVLLSPAAAEGLAPGEPLPQELVLEQEPTARALADAIQVLAACDASTLDGMRREMCKGVLAAHRGGQRQHQMEQAATILEQLIETPPRPQPLARVSRLFLDRRRPLREIASAWESGSAPVPSRARADGTLSVVVTSYGMGAMVKEAVESVWASEKIPEEVLLVDDGSRDPETLATIRELEHASAGPGRPLRVIRQDNVGLAAARNVGLEAARGEFISFVDGDDIMGPRFYRLAVPLLRRYPELGGVGSWAYCFNENGIVGYWNGWQPELPSSFTDNVVIVPCVTRTELLRRLGGYDVAQRYNYEDWELSLRMLIRGWPIVVLPEYLMKYRERSDSLLRSMTEVQNQVMREQLYETHRDHVARFGPEIALRLENRLLRRLEAPNPAGSWKSELSLGNRLGNAARHGLRYLCRRTWGKTTN